MTLPTIRRIVYKNWAGLVTKGTKQWLPASIDKKNHLDKATWLTSAVEVGAVFGTVQSYDGAAMSAGIEQKIAVLPKSLEQGSLWEFLTKIEEALEPSLPRSAMHLFSAIDQAGWYLDPRGILRDKNTGNKVPGQEIRNEFTPQNGVVPASGPLFDQASRWIGLFADLFSDPVTFPIQTRQAKLGLLNLHRAVESQVYKKYCGITDASVAICGKNISPELDLAMCIYHSFSVNAPSKARQTLELVFGKNLSERSFCHELVKALGTSTYGNWKVRYTRTWSAAKNSGLFEDSLFTSQSVAPATFTP